MVNDTWEITPPDVAVLYKPGQRHLYRANHTEYVNSWAHIKCSTPLINEYFPFGQPIILHNPKDYYELLLILRKEYCGSAPHRSSILSSLTTVLLDKLSDESSVQNYPDIYYPLVKLREQIYTYPAGEWTTQMMAQQLNISTAYLHSLYRQYFHTTCINDVIRSRIQAACDLLLSNNTPLNEIAELCGYHNVEHFNRQFKSIMGCTPGKYRKQEHMST